MISISPAAGQTPVKTPSTSQSTAQKIPPGKKLSLEKNFFKNIIKDQGEIWTSPFRLGKSDLRWFLPLTAVTGGLIATDRRSAAALGDNRGLDRASRGISQAGSFYAAGGTALGFYAVGKITGNQRAAETGLLAGEALINTGIVVQILKFATQRPRPQNADGHGRFFTGGDSFPSGHSSSAWSVATVIAEEYGQRHPFIKYGAYGFATLVSASRFTAKKHFLSDALIGSAIGYGIGRFTYRKHHDTDLDSSTAPKNITKLEKYFPLIRAQYGRQNKINGVSLVWGL